MPTRQPQKKGCSCCTILLSLVILGAIGTGLGIYFGVIDQEDIDNFGDKVDTLGDSLNEFLGQIIETDPFAGDGANGTEFMWSGASGNGGLELELQNALTDEWQSYFNEAVTDWESGAPDALSLSTKQITAESKCSPVNGVMKVCNGDYGDTGWRGINEFSTSGNNRIISSVAKMNEFYLSPDDTDERQYTMCHEIGHGFGLPHTDENFYNPTLGNCLDYTEIRKSDNLKPGQVNYDKLARIYGVVGERRLRRRATSSVNDEDGNEKAPAWVQETLERKMRHLESKLEHAHEEGWVLVHQNDLRQYHTVDLGAGYRGHANVLLVSAP
jgi:hypothetical protein